jgi:hypothetical protein
MAEPSRVDLNDTTGCPQADRCVGCQTTTGLAVHTATALGGVFCLTLCASCEPPRLLCTEVALRTLAHCQHLDIDVDDMAAALGQEWGAEQWTSR